LFGLLPKQGIFALDLVSTDALFFLLLFLNHNGPEYRIHNCSRRGKRKKKKEKEGKDTVQENEEEVPNKQYLHLFAE
jgi:hypothetical protein